MSFERSEWAHGQVVSVGSVDRAKVVAGIRVQVGQFGADDEVVVRAGWNQRRLLGVIQMRRITPTKCDDPCCAREVAIFVQFRRSRESRLHECGRCGDLATHGALTEIDFGKNR